MTHVNVEQALVLRRAGEEALVVGHSPGFQPDWLAEAQNIAVEFGDRPPGVACPRAVFAVPFAATRVAIVQVSERAEGRLGFHFALFERDHYRSFGGDPFYLAHKIPVPGEGQPLPTLQLAAEPMPPRTVQQVRAVLQRVKSQALVEDEEPEAATPGNIETAESPALLGGVQVLVDGGHLIFERPIPDTRLLEGLWTLLPHSTRANLWPASFAFSNQLGFDVLVVPRLRDVDLDGFTTEDQAADYPEGYYELNLQIAAESGDQRALDALFERRSSRETLRLAVVVLVFVTAVVGLGRFLGHQNGQNALPRDYRQRAGVATAIVSSADPWQAIGWLRYGQSQWGLPP